MRRTNMRIAAISAALLSPISLMAQESSVLLYGIIDVAIRHTNNEGALGNPGAVALTQMVGGGMSQSRWGFNVSEDLGGGAKALANMESRFTTQTGAVASPNLFQQSWVGLQGDYGRLTAGRQYNVLFDLVTSSYASYPYSPYFDAYKPEIGFALGARASNMVKYTVEKGPYRGAIQYSFDNASPMGGKTLGGYFRYSQDGLTAGVGYQDYEFASGKKVKAATLGGSYRLGSWYFNAGYAQNKVDALTNTTDLAVLGSLWQGTANGGFGGPSFLSANKRTIYKLGAGYQLTSALNLGAHYFHTKQTGTTATAEGSANFFTVALDYAFSKRTDAYFEMDNTRLSGNAVSLSNSAGVVNGAKSRTGYTVGLRHRF